MLYWEYGSGKLQEKSFDNHLAGTQSIKSYCDDLLNGRDRTNSSFSLIETFN